MNNNIMKKYLFIIYGFLFSPIFFVQAKFDSSDVKSLIISIHNLINKTLIPLLVLITLAYTIYTVVNFLAATENSEQRKEKKKQIFSGIIGLFIIVSIWALIAIVGRTFGIFAGGVLTTG